jgi:hypothetical protein
LICRLFSLFSRAEIFKKSQSLARKHPETGNVIERCVFVAKGNLIDHVALPAGKPKVISEKAEEVRLKRYLRTSGTT